MSVVRNIDNIKYFAPIAISRLYEKQQQQYFNYKVGSSNSIFHQRRIQSEKQFEKMQKMMFAKNKDGEYTQVTSPTWQQHKQTQEQQTQEKQPQKELQ